MEEVLSTNYTNFHELRDGKVFDRSVIAAMG